MNALKQFFRTDQQSWHLLISRVALGVVVLPHGMQKALGTFGGNGFMGTLEGLSQYMGIPVVIGVLVILAEFVGSIGLILGIATRFMAFSIFVTFIGAMVMGGHLAHGFFMNWRGQQAGEGIEFFILVLGMALGLLIAGGGKYALDNQIYRRLK